MEDGKDIHNAMSEAGARLVDLAKAAIDSAADSQRPSDRYGVFIAISDIRSSLATIKRSIDDMYNQLSLDIADEMLDEGVESVKVGGRTIYIREDRYPKIKGEDRDEAVEALAACNATAHLVNKAINLQSLRAAMFGSDPIFETTEDGEPVIPSELSDYLGYDSKIVARVAGRGS